MSNDYSGEVVEVEVARYGLRTFRHIPADEAVMKPHDLFLQQILRTRLFWEADYGPYASGQPMELCSTSLPGSHWKGGVCEATCQKRLNPQQRVLIELAALTTGVEPVFAHEAPQEDCHCGVYAAHTLEVLRAQFGSYVNDIVAVVAAEGQTIIGDKGFRTQRARVVAYWCSDRVAPTAQSQFAEAQRFSDMLPMLAQYGLDAGERYRPGFALTTAANWPVSLQPWLVDPPRKRRRLGFAATVWLTIFGAILGAAVVLSARAHADPVTPEVAVYAVKNADPVCSTLDEYPSIPGLQGVMQGVAEDGFTAAESGQIVALAVQAKCPQFIPLLQQFVSIYAPQKREAIA